MDKIHRCLGENCDQPITWTFAICRKCEKIYGRRVADWPEWLHYMWKQEQVERRQHVKVATNELPLADLEAALDGYYDD